MSVPHLYPILRKRLIYINDNIKKASGLNNKDWKLFEYILLKRTLEYMSQILSATKVSAFMILTNLRYWTSPLDFTSERSAVISESVSEISSRSK